MKPILHLLLIVTLAIISLPSSGQGVVTIPTVVHVIWNDSTENISDARIQSQIDSLNNDFRKLNADTINIPQPFLQYAGDAQIEFCLAQRDTNGNPTTGITRTFTTETSFYQDSTVFDSLTATALGSARSWNPIKYFNIWIFNNYDIPLPNGGSIIIVSWGTYPVDFFLNPSADGVFIRWDYFIEDFEKRELNRQVSSWLNLYATDEFSIGNNCYDDSLADTPPVDTPFFHGFRCPVFPINPNSTCGTDSNGEMATNFMAYNYTNGDCRNFFTLGQIARMHACLNTTRSGLLISDGCTPVGINELTNDMNLKLFPNPSSGTFSIITHNLQKAKLEIYNLMGSIIYEQSLTSSQSVIDISGQTSGIYFVFITNGSDTWSQKIIKD